MIDFFSNLYKDSWAEQAVEGISGTVDSVTGALGLPDDYSQGLDGDLAQSEYDFRSLIFPNDLGMDDNGHYIIININVPTKSNDGTALAGEFTTTENYTTALDPVKRSKVDTLRFAGDLGRQSQPRPFYRSNGQQGLVLPRRTRRIKESIALHMPTPVLHHDKNEYQEMSLTEIEGRIVTGALAGIEETFVGRVARNTTGAGAPTSMSEAGAGVVAGAARLSGNPINPAIEVLFSTKYLRSYVFDFLMAPRNETESVNMREIIKALRFHSSPELNGYLWIPPAEFDITFFNKGVENISILRMNTCVMEAVEVDYTPTGIYSTFTNGHPVIARLQLHLRELEPIHKKRVLQGF